MDSYSQNVTTALPKLPGFNFPELHDRSTLSKAQTLTFRGGIASCIVRDNSGVRPEKAAITKDDIFRVKPQWRTLSEKVLRFFAYFTERLDEGASEESLWHRKVTISLFLQDNTVQIMEPGGASMRFLKRDVVEGVRPETLKVGSSITVNRRTFNIYDCDDFTRDLYACLGKDQPAAQTCPTNKFDIVDPRNPKRAVEPGRRLESAINRSLLENDKKVLRFMAQWEDPSGESRKFFVLYYIADGTISVQERIPPNSGRDPVGNFFKRARLPMGCETTAVTKGLDTIAPKSSQRFYTHKDLEVGGELRVYGRQLIIYDADEFTRRFYADLGMDLAPGSEEPLLHTQSSAVSTTLINTQVTLPPHMGFGSDEDSLGSVKYLVLKPPKKDTKKLLERGNDILRYRATLYNARPEDAVRQFVVCCFLADDTVSVFEQAATNTGFSTGRFLTRQRIKTSGPMEPARYLKAEDFVVGSTVTIYGHTFQLEEIDERTAKLLDGAALEDAGVDVTELVAKLRDIIVKKYSRHTDAFRAYNVSKGRGLTVEELERMFRDNVIHVSLDDVHAVMRYLDVDEDGYVGFGEFINVMMAEDEDTVNKALARRQHGGSSEAYRRAAGTVHQKQFSARVFKMFRDKLQSRRLVLADAFRIMTDKSSDALVGWSEFRSVVADALQLNFTPEELDALCAKFFVARHDVSLVDRNRRLTLKEFQRLLDQDVYAL